MTRRATTAGILTAALALTGTWSATAVQDSQPAASQPTSAAVSPLEGLAQWVKNAQPNENHRRLTALAGDWELTVHSIDPGTGERGESTGTAAYRAILDGRFLVEEVRTTLDGQPFEWFGLYGYDNARQRYIGTWADTFGTGTVSGEGVATEEGQVITFAGQQETPTGTPTRFKWIWRFRSADTWTVEMIALETDGKESKVLEILQKRKTRGS